MDNVDIDPSVDLPEAADEWSESNAEHPAQGERVVSLLSDDCGPYGLAVSSNPDSLRRAQFGLDPGEGCRLVARPDVVAQRHFHDDTPSLFQPFGTKSKWAKGPETQLAEMAAEHLISARGLWPNDNDRTPAFWRRYYATRASAWRIVSARMNDLVREAVPAEYARIIRRYPVGTRSELYRAICDYGERFAQLAESFPVLALDLAREPQEPMVSAVQSGSKLNDIADSANLAMALRRFPPAVAKDARRVASLFNADPQLVSNYAPRTVPKQRSWLRAIRVAQEQESEEYAHWVARRGMELASWRDVPEAVRNLNDWVSASRQAGRFSHLTEDDAAALAELMWFPPDQARQRFASARQRAELIERPFNPRMDPQTALTQSQRWHEATARIEALDEPFPAPWYSGDTVDGYAIEPISDSVTLTQVANRLHNCAAQYDRPVIAGERFLYSVTQNDRLAGLLELVRGSDQPELGQVAGPFNAKPSRGMKNAVNKWLRQRRKAEGMGAMPQNTAVPQQTDNLPDDPMDVPF